MTNKLQDYILKYKEQIDQAIYAELDKRKSDVKQISPHLEKIIEAMQELSLGGKRMRAILTILGYELAGQAVNKEIIKAAAMMEIFHLGLLIQDDFMDNDMLRRGVKTMLARYSDRHIADFVSMLAGDYTFGWGIEIISNLEFSNSQIVAAMKVWGKYFTRVGYGQTLDGLAIADEKSIKQILEMKSGEYSCVLPLLFGATLGGADDQLIQNIGKYAMEIGYVFQLRDDWLGEYGESDKTGKPVGNDSREGKHTFATMKGKEKTEAEIKKHMELAKGFANGNEILEALIEWMGTRNY